MGMGVTFFKLALIQQKMYPNIIHILSRHVYIYIFNYIYTQVGGATPLKSMWYHPSASINTQLHPEKKNSCRATQDAQGRRAPNLPGVGAYLHLISSCHCFKFGLHLYPLNECVKIAKRRWEYWPPIIEEKMLRKTYAASWIPNSCRAASSNCILWKRNNSSMIMPPNIHNKDNIDTLG